ncbi:Endoplasmic reticulum-Golgi intermediate compartment protein 3 [Cryptosporidium felis]|nr:Endoplasmic reticulum-Golgi intermediate compartment protein 3 [Cryptosporidium felis]
MNKTYNENLGVRRRKGSVILGNLAKVNGTLQSKVKEIDIYGKIHEDYCMKSTSKSIISLFVYFIVAILTFCEISKYLKGEFVDNIGVDNHINNKLDIKLDITFPRLRCEEASVDTVDNVGENQVDARGNLSKIPIDLNGKEVKQFSENQNDTSIDCMSCYGAESDEYQCCNDCNSLKSAYRYKGWSYLDIVNKAPQCLEKVGCRIRGNIQVNRVSGNIHVALGAATVKNGKHVHEFNMNDISRGFNTSHIINELKFGSDLPHTSSPLEKVEKYVHKGTKMFHYYVKLIPTQFTSESKNSSLYGNQYIYTEREKDVHVHNGELSGLPGIFIVYDFQPFLLKRIRRSMPLSHLITSFCAIVGGIYTVMSLLDSIIAMISKDSFNTLLNFILESNQLK